MRIKKITIFVLLIATAVAFFGCGKTRPAGNGSVNENININNNGKANISNSQNANLNSNTNTDNEISEEPKEELIQEENGWKHYVNHDLGVEFRFRDESGLIDAAAGSHGDNIKIVKRQKEDLTKIEEGLIYIHILNGVLNSSIPLADQYKDAEEYGDANWDKEHETCGTIKTIKNKEKITNKNNFTYWRYQIEFNKTIDCWTSKPGIYQKVLAYASYIFLEKPKYDLIYFRPTSLPYSEISLLDDILASFKINN